MNTQSRKRRALRLVGLAAALAVAATLAGTTVASAQPRSDRGPWEKLDLSKEQREKVRDIVKQHREESRDALHKKLATVLTDEQLAQLEKMGERRRGGKAMRRGDRGMGGPGPRMGEFRQEGGERMVKHLAKALDLTDEQTEKIATIVEEHHAQFEDFDPSTLTFEERQKTREAHRMLLANRVKEVLTDEQQAKYDEFMKTMPGPRRGGHKRRH